MSDIKQARAILQQALVQQTPEPYEAMKAALELMYRERPTFIAKREVRALSPYNRQYARELRATGMALNKIARQLNTNIGRVSEACE